MNYLHAESVGRVSVCMHEGACTVFFPTEALLIHNHVFCQVVESHLSCTTHKVDLCVCVLNCVKSFLWI